MLEFIANQWVIVKFLHLQLSAQGSPFKELVWFIFYIIKKQSIPSNLMDDTLLGFSKSYLLICFVIYTIFGIYAMNKIIIIKCT